MGVCREWLVPHAAYYLAPVTSVARRADAAHLSECGLQEDVSRMPSGIRILVGLEPRFEGAFCLVGLARCQ
jgi:hypothetical protein